MEYVDIVDGCCPIIEILLGLEAASPVDMNTLQ